MIVLLKVNYPLQFQYAQFFSQSLCFYNDFQWLHTRMRWVLYLSALLTVTAAVTNVVSVGLPYWLYTRNPQEAYQGLWQRCEAQSSLRSNSQFECVLIKLPPGIDMYWCNFRGSIWPRSRGFNPWDFQKAHFDPKDFK